MHQKAALLLAWVTADSVGASDSPLSSVSATFDFSGVTVFFQTLPSSKSDLFLNWAHPHK